MSIEKIAKQRLVEQAPSRLLPPYRGEGFWKQVRGWAEIGYNLIVRNSILNSKRFFSDLLPDVRFEDLKMGNPVAVVFITSGKQAVIAISDDKNKFQVPEEAPEIPVHFEGMAHDIARGSSSIPLLMSRHPIEVDGVTVYPTDGAAYRGLPSQFMRHKYRLSLSTHAPPVEKIKPAKPEMTGWWLLGVPFQSINALMTTLEGVTLKDEATFMVVGDGDEDTYELSHNLLCGDFRKQNNIDATWLNLSGHTPEVVEQIFDFGVKEADKWWAANAQHHEGILEHGLAVCMSGGGGDGYAQCGFMARIRDIIGKPFAATSGVSAGAINAVFFAWLETQLEE